MVSNFWVDKRRARLLAEHRAKVAAYFKMADFDLQPKFKQYEMLEEYLRESEKKAKKSPKK